MKKILIVDTYNMTYRHVYKILNENGYETVWAGENEDPSGLLDDSIDLVLIDLEYDKNSLDFVQQVKAARYAHIPVVVISYASDRQAVVKALEFGAIDYIIKPFHHSFLLDRIRNILDLPKSADAMTEYITFNYHELLEIELKRAYRGKHSLSLILISFADKMHMSKVTGILEESLRDIDTVIRYGPEQTLIFLPMTNKDGANYVIERIRSSLSSLEFLEEVSGIADFKAATATFPEDATDKKGLFARLQSS